MSRKNEVDSFNIFKLLSKKWGKGYQKSKQNL